MVPHRVNRTLIVLAVIGLILYVSIMALNVIGKPSSVEEDLSVPAVTKQAAADAAVSFVRKQFPGADPAGTTVVYEADQELSGYLQKSGYADEYNNKYAKRYPLDYWQVEVKLAASSAAYLVKVGMETPEIAGWEKIGTAPRPPAAEGVKIAEKTFESMGFKTGDFVYTPENKQGRGEQTDATLFTFESKSIAVGEAKLLLQVQVRGSEAVSFKPAFSVPSGYLTWLHKQETAATWMTRAYLASTVALGIAALVYAIKYGRFISFKRGIVLSVVYTACYTVLTLNMMPAIRTQTDMNNTVVVTILTAISLFLVLLSAASLYLSLLAGDALWRYKGWNGWPRWRDDDFGAQIFYAMGRGYLLCLFILGVQQVLFFLEEKSFHAFGVSDPSQSPLNMLWPGLYPTAAWLAGISEEITFRLFGIILFKKLFRNTFAAILVSSVFWAFGHAGYTIYPSYTRLIEVAILGFIFSYAFLKYGLYTAIFAHVSMDSLLMALQYATGESSPGAYATGFFYAALPAIVGYAVMLLHGRLKPKRPLPAAPPEAT